MLLQLLMKFSYVPLQMWAILIAVILIIVIIIISEYSWASMYFSLIFVITCVT